MPPANKPKKGGMMVTNTDNTVERISTHKNVDGVIVCTRDGIPINTTMDSTATTLFLDGLMTLEKRCSNLVREFDPTNEVRFFCVTTKRYDITMAPRNDHIGTVIQRREN